MGRGGDILCDKLAWLRHLSPYNLMNQNTLNRLLELIGKTDDKVVITDPAGEKPYVLMSLDQYEKLMNGSAAQKAAPAPQPKPAKRPSLQVAEDLDPPVTLKGMTSFEGQKRDIPLWKSPQETAKPPLPVAPLKTVQEGPFGHAQDKPETESEEQFYLEPLE